MMDIIAIFQINSHVKLYPMKNMRIIVILIHKIMYSEIEILGKSWETWTLATVGIAMNKQSYPEQRGNITEN